MQFIFDDLTATIVAMTALLLLLTVQSRAVESNVARTSRNMMKEQAQSFSTWLEKDLEQIGQNMDKEERKDQRPFKDPKKEDLDDGDTYTKQFTFYRDRGEGNTETRIATRYEIEQVSNKSRPLFQLTRKTREVGKESWDEVGVDGQSPPSLGYFKVDLLDRDAKSTTNYEDVRSVRVRFSVVSPFHNEESVAIATHTGSVLMVQNSTSGDGSAIKSPEDKSDCKKKGWRELQRPDGTAFKCAATCLYYATDGAQGTASCSDDGEDDDDPWFCDFLPGLPACD